MPLNKYAPQVATHRRTQSAILEGAKTLIATVGLNKMSMIEIADISEVSRATLYNHYRDKESVIAALCESEVERLVTIAQSAPTSTDALELLSLAISQDLAIAAMRAQDPQNLTIALSAHDHVLWKGFAVAMSHIVPNHVSCELAIRWLIGQALYPLTPVQSRQQAEALTGFANL